MAAYFKSMCTPHWMMPDNKRISPVEHSLVVCHLVKKKPCRLQISFCYCA